MTSSTPPAVAWLPWGPEAFARARAQRRPILLSITASWCHGCAVMDTASYGDARVAGQPEHFVEISEELAAEKGIRKGDMVKVSSNRGQIKAVAVVTKRIPVLNVDGRKVHTVGIPLHYGFKGETKPGYITNTLTPFVGDANSQTPEYKAFLVDIEKA